MIGLTKESFKEMNDKLKQHDQKAIVYLSGGQNGGYFELRVLFSEGHGTSNKTTTYWLFEIPQEK